MEAALKPDKEKVVKAFMNDPLVKGKNCREEDIRLLVDDMIKIRLNIFQRMGIDENEARWRIT